MTSASELFHNRRSRWGRSNSHFTFDSVSPEPTSFFRRRHSNHRRDSNDGDHLRRSSHHARHLGPWVSYPEQTTAPINPSESEFSSGTSTNIDILGSSSRLGFIGNDRLPGAVLLARARLLERLRGVTLSENRHNGIDVTLFEPSTIAQTIVTSPFDLTSQLQFLQEQSRRLPGLTQEALDGLNREVFSSAEEGAPRDCSICLECFKDGDNLIHLLCDHRFHGACLDPWLRTCGDCPNCRRGIIID